MPSQVQWLVFDTAWFTEWPFNKIGKLVLISLFGRVACKVEKS